MPDGGAKDTLDFIVIGAQKAATTTLFQHLRHHPELALPNDKEAPFFSNDAIYARGWPAYLDSLAGSGGVNDPTLRWGTVSPQYMLGGVLNASADAAGNCYDERTVPLRIREQLPDVRLIAILRDPVQRAYSHYSMIVRRGSERRSFAQAIDETLRPRGLEQARRRPEEATGYVAWGEYGRILAGYLDVFAPEQLLVVFTDELEGAPVALMRRVHEFIGVSADFVAPNIDGRYFVGKPQRGFAWTRPASWMLPGSPIGLHGLRRAAVRSAALRTAWHALPLQRQRRLWRGYERFATRAVRRSRTAGARDAEEQAAPDLATLARLADHYSEDRERLTALLGAAPPWGGADALRR
jgi:Sulfotransferase family